MTKERSELRDEQRIIYDIERDGEGVFRQVWVHQPVVSPEPLVFLQRELADAVPNFAAIGQSHLHLTVAHLGRPHTMFTEIKTAAPDISALDFISAYNQLLETCNGAIPEEHAVNIVGLMLLGEERTSIALKIEKNQELLARRDKITKGLFAFVSSFGISNPEEFMLKSPNLKLEPDSVYKPHITLGRTETRPPTLPALVLPEQVRLGASVLKNARRRR